MNHSASDAIQRELILHPRETSWSAPTFGQYRSLVIVAAMATMTLACVSAPAASPALIADRTHPGPTDARGSASATISGEMTQLQFTESAEPAIGRSTAPGALSGWLVLRNVSATQIVRVTGVDIRYVLSRERLGLGAGRTTTASRRLTTPLSFEPLEPGETVAQSVQVEIPTTKNLKEVRFEFSYAVSPTSEGNYPPRDDQEQTLRFVVLIPRG